MPASSKNANHGWCAALTALSSLLALMLLLRRGIAPTSDNSAPAPPAPASVFASTAAASSMVEIRLGGEEHKVWASASVDLADSSTVGVALLFHGCSHSGEVWATGSEEAVLVAALSRARIYAIALSSASGVERGGCWQSFPTGGAGNADLEATVAVAAALAAAWTRHHRATPMRLFAVGASSGGAFATLLPLHLRLDAVVSYIMPPHPAVMPSLASAGGVLGAERPPLPARSIPASFVAVAYPPTALVHMPRDYETAEFVADAAGALRASLGGERVLTLELLPRRIDAQTFSAAMPALITEAASIAIFERIRDAEGGALLTRDESLGLGAAAPARSRAIAAGRVDGGPPAGVWLARSSRSAAIGAALFASVGDPAASPPLLPPALRFLASRGVWDAASAMHAASPVHSAADAARVAAAHRILARNVAEVLNERYAEHEMSGQHAEEVVAFLCTSAAAARAR